MARVIHKLTAASLAKLQPGFHSDGGGLYLAVGQSSDGNRSWVFRYARHGRQHDLGMGPFPAISLSDARTKAEDNRRKLAHGVDPLAERRAMLASAVTVPTFQDSALAYIDSHKASWKASSLKQWESTLKQYAYPVIGKLAVSSVTTDHVMRILNPVWSDKPVTADRVRGRIESVINYAKARSHFSGENPARWQGHLDQILPRISAEVHHKAVAIDDISGVMGKLESLGNTDIAALALRFVILTASRGVEVRGARWDEFAWNAWTVPASRMKAKKEHRVPLSNQAVSLLASLPLFGATNGFVFSLDGKKPISTDAMLDKLASIGVDATVHGMRSTFSDWRGERTSFPSDLAELALAHVIKNKVEAAYRRGDQLEKRFPLMQAWADHCTKVATTAAILPLKSVSA